MLLASGSAVVFMAACAEIFGVHGADTDGGTDAAAKDTSDDYLFRDAISLDVNTAVCEGGITPVADSEAVFVSGTGNDTAACTRDAPCATINHALSVIGARKVVYLDHATFTEALALDSTRAGFTIQGGFERGDGGWTPQCDNSLSVIQEPDDGGPSAVDIAGANAITLRLLTVRSKTNGNLGESVYAVRVFDTKGVVLDNVTLLAQSGGPGANGASGTTGVGCVQLANGSGSPGAPGAPGDSGTLGPTGLTPVFGGHGGDGSVGSGSPGSGGACGFCAVCTP